MLKQRTINETVELEGTGLQTGKSARLKLKTSPVNSGINFIRVDLPNKPLLNIGSLALEDADLKERRTTLGVGPLEIQTTEHLLAALSGLSIDNIVIEMDNIELPGLDGSSKGFVEVLKKAGVVEQDAPKRILRIDEPLWTGAGDSLLAVFPDEDFRISYTLSYDNQRLGTQFFSIILNEETFENEIAPARTFCLEEEALELLRRGLGKGANYDNTLVIGKDGPIKNNLRFPNEPVRHKILDIIGDLYLLGSPIKGHVIAVKSGHRLNMELVRKLKGAGYGKRGA